MRGRIRAGSRLDPARLEAALAAHDEALAGRGTVLNRTRHGAVTRVDVAGDTLCVKEYGRGGFVQRLRDRLFGSRGERAWRGAERLRSLAIPSPEALALLERDGAFYLVMRFVREGVALSRLLLERFAGVLPPERLREKRALLRELGRWLRRIHDAGVYHDDWSPKNILAVGRGAGWEFLLLDLEAVRPRQRPNRRRRMKNLGQVCDFDAGITTTDRMRCLVGYAGGDRTLSRGSFPRGVLASARGRAERRARRFGDARDRAITTWRPEAGPPR
jgi:tRNA A-37 threonylcarbamoyl transferase component Bud32